MQAGENHHRGGLEQHGEADEPPVDTDEQVRRLTRTPRYHEFLLIQGDRSNVVRVPADPFSRWVFTTSLRDRERFARLAEERPDLSLLDQVRLLAAEG